MDIDNTSTDVDDDKHCDSDTGTCRKNICVSQKHSISPSDKKFLQDALYICDLQPNQLLFFPANWMHATLNLDSYNVFMSLFLDPQLMHDD